ncbi:MAG TPA: hypothetical protein VI874_05425, partial [Candidatus Norongarragalinales archaeon]|nr:hypothetical protein [Candidatus Norongarragalinales archaeon]
DALDVLAVARRTLNGRRLTELCFVQDGKALPVFSKSGYFPRFFSSRIFSHLGHSRQEFLEKIRQFEHALKQKKDDFTSSAGTT